MLRETVQRYLDEYGYEDGVAALVYDFPELEKINKFHGKPAIIAILETLDGYRDNTTKHSTEEL